MMRPTTFFHPDRTPPNGRRRRRRQGAALVMLIVCLVPLIAFLALAIDLGMLAAARTQCQDAADVAALAGVRTLNGNTANGANNNYAGVTPAASAAATANSVFSTAILPSQVSVQIGRYTYNSGTQRFEGQIPGPATDNWTLVKATVNFDMSQRMAFSKALRLTVPTMQARATAVHRPRDVVTVLDYSGSMRFESLFGQAPWGNRASNNGDGNIPLFGHYSNTAAAALTASSFSIPYLEANATYTTSDGRPAICADFYQDSAGTPAFTQASAGYGTTPGGDNFLKINKNAGATYATNVADVLNLSNVTSSTRDAAFEGAGYRAYGMAPGQLNRYTQGPGYYGKTFFIWPPDPANGADGQTNDWRKRYFTYPLANTPMDNNLLLWNTTGNWQAPGPLTYHINYTAILDFIKNIGPNAFQPVLKSGRILYYDQIPSAISNPPADLNQQFWKDYIDYVLGVLDDGSGNYSVICDGNNGLTGYGPDYAWGNVQITTKPIGTRRNRAPYMNYADNPLRPRLHFWFGPLSMVDFLGNYNLWYNVSPVGSRFCWWPGTCHEAPMYGCKLGMRAALTDIQNNHPNDLLSLITFSVPKSSAADLSGGRFNAPIVGLGTNYANMQDALWYPPATIGNASATVRPYDANNLEVPRAFGGTCYAMPLMLAYNQFSGANSLVSYNSGAPAGNAGGNGRHGAQKIIIFETDGAPNTNAIAGFTNSGPYQSYYNVRYNSASPGGSEFPYGVSGYNDNDPTVTAQIFNICKQIVALDSASSPGFSTAARPVQIHCIGFGAYFAPGSPEAAANTATLNQMQTIGNVNDGMPSYKIIYGNQNTVVANLQQAIGKILESTVPVALIQ